MSNVSLIKPVGPDQMAATIETIKRNAKFLIEYHQIHAEIRWNAFKAYTAKGFTPEQAIELCTKL